MNALLEHKADPFHACVDGGTPISIALETGRTDILTTLHDFFVKENQTENLKQFETILKAAFDQILHHDIKEHLEKVKSPVKPDQIHAQLPPEMRARMSSDDIKQLVESYHTLNNPEHHKQHQRGFETPEHLAIGAAINIFRIDGTANTFDNVKLYKLDDKNNISAEDYGIVTYSDLVALPDYLAISKGTISKNPELFVASFNKLDVKDIDKLKQKIYAINDKQYVKSSSVNDIIQQIALVKEMGISYYFTLTDNFDHFAPDAFLAYQAGHTKALEMAKKAHACRDPNEAERYLQTAYALNAYAGHYLSDNFASGHMRTPRRELADRFGSVIGGALANSMHNEDNQFGIQVKDGNGTSWTAFGDSSLEKEDGAANKKHVINTLQVSANEIFAAANPEACAADPKKFPVPPDLNKMIPKAIEDQTHQPLMKVDKDGKIFIRSELNDISCKKYHELNNWNVVALTAFLRSPLYKPENKSGMPLIQAEQVAKQEETPARPTPRKA